MINGYRRKDGALVGTPDATGNGVIWIDVLRPSEEERASLSDLIGITLPSRADQGEIEQSSRLYLDGGVPVMTVLLPAQSDQKEPVTGPVTFVLTQDRLITIRHHDPRPFTTYPPRAGRNGGDCATADAVLIGLVEEIIDRLADITEQAGQEIDLVSRRTFQTEDGAKHSDHRATLRQIGLNDGLLMQLRESLLTVERMTGYLAPVLDNRKTDKGLRDRLKIQIRDVHTISEQAGFLQQKTGLLLDATLGLINIEQNAIIKIFSVAAVAFLPPTLIASIYGMNFTHMPELQWRLGYPLAVILMIVSAALPMWYFRRRGWL